MKFLKSTIITLSLLLASVVAHAQSSQSTLLPSSTLAPFTSIKVDGEIELTLVKGGRDNLYKIEYDVRDNEANKFKFSTKSSGELVISLSSNVRSIDKVRATIYYDKIERLVASFAQVEFATPFEASIVDIELNNAATIKGQIECDDLDLTLISESRAELNGSSKYLTLRAQSNSKAELRQLNITSARITTSQSSVVALTAGERLDVGAATKSVVKYWGEPKILRLRSSLIGGEVVRQ
ncbi:MAG: DUF2807 domain-containing protein [Rikenellaceae bacterium]